MKENVAALKLEIEDLKKENERLETQIESYDSALSILKSRCGKMETDLNNMAVEYSSISNLIKQATNVFSKTILMALKEDK